MKTPFNEDDYFQPSTMSFGQHLEELRTSLIKALYGLALAMLVGVAAFDADEGIVSPGGVGYDIN